MMDAAYVRYHPMYALAVAAIKERGNIGLLKRVHELERNIIDSYGHPVGARTLSHVFDDTPEAELQLIIDNDLTFIFSSDEIRRAMIESQQIRYIERSFVRIIYKILYENMRVIIIFLILDTNTGDGSVLATTAEIAPAGVGTHLSEIRILQKKKDTYHYLPSQTEVSYLPRFGLHETVIISVSLALHVLRLMEEIVSAYEVQNTISPIVPQNLHKITNGEPRRPHTAILSGDFSARAIDTVLLAIGTEPCVDFSRDDHLKGMPCIPYAARLKTVTQEVVSQMTIISEKDRMMITHQLPTNGYDDLGWQFAIIDLVVDGDRRGIKRSSI